MKRFGFLFLVVALASCGSAQSSAQGDVKAKGAGSAEAAAGKQAQPAAPSSLPKSEIRTEGAPSLGPDDASVTVVAWSDFQ